MAKNTQQLKNKWEERHVQYVLTYCNRTTNTHLKIRGRAEDIYPELKKGNWDLVCYDTRTEEEIAVEVKRLTDFQKEKEYGAIRQALTEVEEKINTMGVLQGTYLLSSQIHLSKTLLFVGKNNKTEFKYSVFKVICESSKSMEQGEEKLLTPPIKQQLSFQLPDLISLTLCKISAKGRKIGKGFGINASGSIEFKPNELEEFRQLVTYANKQLGISKPRKTMLVIIEEGFRHKNPLAVTDAFSKIKPDSYSNIDYVYFVRGKEVTEILLHNST